MHCFARWATFTLSAVIMSVPVCLAEAPARDALVQVFINGEPQDDWALIRVSGEADVRVTRAHLVAWGIVLPDETLAAAADDGSYVQVARLVGIQAHLDTAGSRLDLVVLP